MIKTAGIIAFTATMLATSHLATATEYGAPLVDTKSPAAAEIESMMSAALRPLDAVTRPVNKLIEPITGSAGFTTSRSTGSLAPDSATAARTRKSLATSPASNPN